ncbi:ABC transporter permease [Paenibacillus yanchengensis]|uniref:ABC transporter permease n=1 Tax=Paenibacillus yanchengensis TaxID=2035833 RepID=A0ABW4YI12_9BACL
MMQTIWRIGKKTFPVLLGLSLLLVIWQLIVVLGHYERTLLPAPMDVAIALQQLIISGELWQHLRISLFRFLIGYLLATMVAIPLGIMLGRLPRLYRVIDPIVQLLRPVSPIAWSPFIVLWFGIGNIPAIVIIFLAAFFPILLSAVAGVRQVPEIYLKLSQNLQLSPLAMLRKIVFPAAFPHIASGLHMAVGTAWIFLVSGEMVGAQSGLGFLIIDARNMIRLDLVLAGIISIGLCGLLLDQAVRLFERMMQKRWGA